MGVLDEEVEDESDEADEGKDGNAYGALFVRGVQLVLGNAPETRAGLRREVFSLGIMRIP